MIVKQHHLIKVRRMGEHGLFDSLRAVFFSVKSDEDALLTAENVQKSGFVEISDISRAQPPVAEGLFRGPFVLPVPHHDVFSLHADFSLLTLRHRIPFVVGDHDLQRGENASRRSELVHRRGVGGNDGGWFGESVSVIHGDPDGVEESLEFDIEHCSSPDHEVDASAKACPNLLEDQYVAQHVKRVHRFSLRLSSVPPVAVMFIRNLQCFAEQSLDDCPLFTYSFFNVLAEILCEGRNAEKKMRTNFPDVDRDVLQRLHCRLAGMNRRNGCPDTHKKIYAGRVPKSMVPGEDEQGLVV